MQKYEMEICYFCGELITKFNGLEKDSLVIHHLNHNRGDNSPENLSPAHQGCHISYHNKGSHPSKSLRTQLLEKYGESISCSFCGEPIIKLRRRDSDSLVIHHINGDQNDNYLENLTPTHFKCHLVYHNKGNQYAKGYKHSEKRLKQLSEAVKGDKNPAKRPEVRQKMRDAWTPKRRKAQGWRTREMNKNRIGEKHHFFKKHLSEEHKRKISKSKKGNPPTMGMTGKHHSEEAKRKMSEAHKGYEPWNKGRKHSKETKKKISETIKKNHRLRRIENGS